MSDKSVQEIMAEIRNASGKARGEKVEKASASGGTGNALKSLFKSYIYDSGEEEVPQAIVTDADGAYPEQPKFEVDLADPNDLSTKPLEEIYSEAGVQSAFSVDQLAEMVNSAELKEQPLNLKLVAINFTLKQQGVTVDEPIEDAAKRDAALDGYAMMLSKRAFHGRKENEEKVQAIDAELQAIFAQKQAEIDALRADSAKKENEYQTFLQRKSEEERRMAETIAPFLSGRANPVTIGNVPSEEEEDANAARLKQLEKIGKVAVTDEKGMIVGEQG